MEIELQIHVEGRWHKAASLSIPQEGFGYKGPSTLTYDLDYFSEIGSAAFAAGAPLLSLIHISEPTRLGSLN